MANHPIVISPASGTVTVTWRGHVVATSKQALELREASYPPVIYVPRADADMRYFARTTRESTCPYKGLANYYSLEGDGASDENAVWTYETPKTGVAEIAGHLAFYPNRVEIVRS